MAKSRRKIDRVPRKRLRAKAKRQGAPAKSKLDRSPAAGMVSERRVRDFIHDLINAMVGVTTNVDYAIDALGDAQPNLEEIRAALADAHVGGRRMRELCQEFRSVVIQAASKVPIVAVPTPGVTRSHGGGRVLVIDDDALVTKAIVRGLEDFEIVALDDARVALELLSRGERFDVVLCDVMMPEMTGAEFFRQLRRNGSDHAERIIFITAGAKTRETKAFIDSVPNVVLKKPFDMAELRALVVRRIGSNPLGPPIFGAATKAAGARTNR